MQLRVVSKWKMRPTGNTVRHTWQSPEAAANYRQSRQPSAFHRYEREEAIMNLWLRSVPPGGRVLDIPCGAGRFVRTITARGLHYIGADVSCAMIGEAQRDSEQSHPIGFLNADVEHIPLADNSVDCVVIWRFLHHMRGATTRQAILREAARVTRRDVILSFHHSLSFTAIRKRLFSRNRNGSGAITHWRLRREAEACGLQLVQTLSFKKYVSINWFAHLVKS
jgi:ubiquinone/menaquinone biosynthesis C-methylase UbiE